MAGFASTIRAPSRQPTRPAASAGSRPGRASVAPSRRRKPTPPGCWNANSAPSAAGPDAGSAATATDFDARGAACAGAAPITAAQTTSARASATRRPRRIAGRSAIAACAALPRSLPATGASAITGSARPAPKASPSTAPIAGSPSATLTAASAHTANVRMKVVKPSPSSTPYRPAASGTGSTRRHDSGTWRRTCGTIRSAARLADRRRHRDHRRHHGCARATRADCLAELRQPAERQHAAGERAEREREAGDERRSQPAGVARRRQRLDHREAARRPRAGDAGGERRGGERPGQHLSTAPSSGST